MSNGDLKSILMAISLLLLIAAFLTAGCIDGSDDVKFVESAQKSSAVVIQPGVDGDGYSWSPDGLTVTITGGYEEYTLSNVISKSITVHVDADEVTLDGNGVPITGIRGNPTLDLRNVHINGGILYKPHFLSPERAYGSSKRLFGITECRNITNSSIVVEQINENNDVNGIGYLYGSLDDSTTITVTGNMFTSCVDTVYAGGVVSGGKFTVNGKYINLTSRKFIA